MAYIPRPERKWELRGQEFNRLSEEWKQRCQQLYTLKEVIHILYPINTICQWETLKYIKEHGELFEKWEQGCQEFNRFPEGLFGLDPRNKMFWKEMENFIKEYGELFGEWEWRLHELGRLTEKSQELERVTEVFHELDPRNKIFWREIENFIKKRLELFRLIHVEDPRNKIFWREIEIFIKELRELFQKWEQRCQQSYALTEKSQELERVTEVFHELDPRNIFWWEIENFIKEHRELFQVIHEVDPRKKIFWWEVKNSFKDPLVFLQEWAKKYQEIRRPRGCQCNRRCVVHKLRQTEQAVKQSHYEREEERESFRLGSERLMLLLQRMTEKVKTLKQEIEEEKYKRIKAEERSQHLSELQEQKYQEVERLTERLQQTEQAVKQSHREREEERECFRLDNERLAQRKTEEVKTLTLALEEEKCKRIKAEECSQHLSELQKQKDQEVERLTEAHLELNLRNKSFQQEIENLKKERQELFGALHELIKSNTILQQHIKKLVEESQGTSEEMRQTFQEVDQARLELEAEHESLRLEKERWSDERMTDVEKRLGQKLDEQIRKKTKAEEISRYLLEENCQLNARVKELMSRQAELAEVSCSAPFPDTLQENLLESNNDLTIGEANEESD